MEQLSERQNTILRHVIEAHIETTQPVGSRYLSEKYAWSFSPATIRHEMGVLEEIGYLTHPHTSSGRIPTDHGYRFYLDHTSFEDDLTEEPFSQAAAAMTTDAEEETAEDFLDRVSLFLSSATREVGLTLMPFAGSSPKEKTHRLKLSLQGLMHILEQPEFQDVRKIKSLLGAFEEKAAMTSWLLKHASTERVSVSVGHEHEHEALEDCAVVTACYSMNGVCQGAIAVLGPKRMPYGRIIPLVSRMAVVVGNILERMEIEE